MSIKFVIGLSFLLVATMYGVWSASGRQPSALRIETGELTFAEYGTRLSRRNLVGMQLYMVAGDYQSEQTFYKKLDHYFALAESREWLSDSSIVVLPEYLGTWLVTAGEKQSVYNSRGIQQALTTMVSSNIFSFIQAYFKARGTDKIKDAVFRMKAEQTAGIYLRTFSHLAEKYGVNIVAGSVILPEPEIQAGELHVGQGALYNVSLLFRSDGTVDDKITVKVYPTVDEQGFIAAGTTDALPVYETKAGRLGIAVCADSWYPDIYERFDAADVEFLAVPSFLVPDGIMELPWHGYSGQTAPKDVNPGDVRTLSEGQAWEKYALLGRIKNSSIAVGLNVFLRGALWDLGSDGKNFMYLSGSGFAGKRDNGSVISCLWL